MWFHFSYYYFLPFVALLFSFCNSYRNIVSCIVLSADSIIFRLDVYVCLKSMLIESTTNVHIAEHHKFFWKIGNSGNQYQCSTQTQVFGQLISFLLIAKRTNYEQSSYLRWWRSSSRTFERYKLVGPNNLITERCNHFRRNLCE